MINTIFFGLNALLLLAIWNFMIKKTLLDHYRDQLFDLRDEVRDFFVQNEIPLDSVIYKNLRDLLNAHLRFTEQVTFAKFIILETEIRKNKSLQNYLKADFENRFNTTDEKLKIYIPKVRERSREILSNHMINTSGAVWLFALGISPFIVIVNIFLVIKKLLGTGFSVLTDGLVSSMNKAFVFIFAVNKLFEKTIRQDLLEEYSFRSGAERKFGFAGA